MNRKYKRIYSVYLFEITKWLSAFILGFIFIHLFYFHLHEMTNKRRMALFYWKYYVFLPLFLLDYFRYIFLNRYRLRYFMALFFQFFLQWKIPSNEKFPPMKNYLFEAITKDKNQWVIISFIWVSWNIKFILEHAWTLQLNFTSLYLNL